MRLTFAMTVAVILAGCTGALTTSDRCWWCYDAEVTSCRSYCLTYSEDGRRCVKFRRGVTDRCVRELLDE